MPVINLVHKDIRSTIKRSIVGHFSGIPRLKVNRYVLRNVTYVVSFSAKSPCLLSLIVVRPGAVYQTAAIFRDDGDHSDQESWLPSSLQL